MASLSKGMIAGMLLFVLILIGGGISGYTYWQATHSGDRPRRTLILQTTTSMDATGLLHLWEPAFETDCPYDLQWVAVGTGQALTNAGNGDGDVVIAHSVANEMLFINHTLDLPHINYEGKGIMRVVFGSNHFVIVGPVSDPAGIGGPPYTTNTTVAFQKLFLAAQQSPTTVKFASRGDLSGTHIKEQELWNATASYPYSDTKTRIS